MMGGLFLKKFREIAERHPDLKLIVDHCGLNRHGQDAEAFIHLDELVALAKLPNVAVKATGAPHYSTEPYPFRNIHDGLHRIFDAFGPKRFFWGTDITRMPCTWRQCITFFTEELPWLKGDDLDGVMGRGLCEWVGWKLKFDSGFAERYFFSGRIWPRISPSGYFSVITLTYQRPASTWPACSSVKRHAVPEMRAVAVERDVDRHVLLGVLAGTGRSVQVGNGDRPAQADNVQAILQHLGRGPVDRGEVAAALAVGRRALRWRRSASPISRSWAAWARPCRTSSRSR